MKRQSMSMNLKQRIHDSGLSYQEIADRSGISRSWLEKYMTGRIPNPGVETYSKVAEAMKGVRKRKHD